jgi:hypothetical protein
MRISTPIATNHGTHLLRPECLVLALIRGPLGNDDERPSLMGAN